MTCTYCNSILDHFYLGIDGEQICPDCANEDDKHRCCVCLEVDYHGTEDNGPYYCQQCNHDMENQ